MKRHEFHYQDTEVVDANFDLNAASVSTQFLTDFENGQLAIETTRSSSVSTEGIEL